MPNDKTTVKLMTLQGVYTEQTVDGKPSSVTFQGLQCATSYRAQAYYDKDGLQSVSNIEAFNSGTCEAYTFGTPVYTRGSNGEHIVTWTYTSVYALTTAIMSDGHGSNWQGVIDSNAGTLTFVMEQSEWDCCGTSYLCNVNVWDIYAIMGGSPSTTIVTDTYNALVTTFVSSTTTTATIQVVKHMDSQPVSVWVDMWAPGHDPATDPADSTEFLQSGSDTVTFTNLNESTQYTFRAGASIDQQTTVYGNVVQDSTQADSNRTTCLTLTSLEDGNTISVATTGNAPANTIEYCTDGTRWTSATLSDHPLEIALDRGESVMFRGNNSKYTGSSPTASNTTRFSATKTFDISGNIMSLKNSTGYASETSVPDAFSAEMFGGSPVVSAANLYLPPVIGAIAAYGMFAGCTSLTAGPSLSRVTYAGVGAFSAFFHSCSSLVTAPDMPLLDTIRTQTCQSMYLGCTSLTHAPSMGSVAGVSQLGMDSMFSGCTSLTQAPSLPSATTAGNRAFASAFAGCTALVTGCDIRGIVTSNRYPNAKEFENMYDGCSSLTTAYCADLQENSQMEDDWLKDVAASGTVICPSQTALDQLPTGSPHGIPSGWTAVVQAP